MPQNLENSTVATGLEKVSFHSSPKEGQCQRMFKLLYKYTHFTCYQGNAQKSFKLGFNSTWTENFQMCRLDLEKTEEPEIKLPKFVGSWRKQGSSRKTSSLTMLRPLTVWITTNGGKYFFGGGGEFLKRWEYHTILSDCWETCMQIKKQENQTWNNRLVQNWERSTLRLYITTLLI